MTSPRDPSAGPSADGAGGGAAGAGRGAAGADDAGGGARFLVVVPTYDNPAMLDECLTSIAGQQHPNVAVCVVDDASPDAANRRVGERHCGRVGWRLVVNDARRGPGFSRWAGLAASAPAPRDIVVFVDGDDCLAHPGVLAALEDAYRRADVWMTSGGCQAESTVASRDERAAGFMALFAERRALFARNRDLIVSQSLYRRIPWCFTQPHSFRAFLWQGIDVADLCRADGTWIAAGEDLAYFYPLLELAGGRIAMLDEVHYRYRLHEGNFDADPRRRRHQQSMGALIRSRRPYPPLRIDQVPPAWSSPGDPS